MKGLSLFILAGVFIVSGSIEGCKGIKPESLAAKSLKVKILTYNVKNCTGMDGVIDYQRVAGIIKRINPDIVALQELDSATSRSNGVVVLSELSKLTGMYQTYGASIEYQGGKYGIGILTREKPVAWKVVPLPGREERRSLLIVELGNVIMGCTHFSLNEIDRIASVSIVSSAFEGYSKPVFIAGDFNAVPESAVIIGMQDYWNILNDTSTPTIPSEKPSRCIDYIMGLKASGFKYQTLQTIVEKEPVASDHLPVWAEIEVSQIR